MTPNTFYVRYGKRLFDLVVAVPTLILFAPLIAILAALVRVFLGTPVIFRQQRPGLGGKIFTVVKFRTMTDARDESGRLLPDAKRLTRFGRLLRSTSLDELPELWNIVVGEMSLVGPRPLLTSYLPYYTERESLRHTVLPGLTGWAQVNGRVNVPWDDRNEMDAWYVENCSFSLDLKILWRTVWKVLRREDIVYVSAARLLDMDEERRLKQLVARDDRLLPLGESSKTGSLQSYGTDQASEWSSIVDSIAESDFYHRPNYHRLAETRGEGHARLYVYREGDIVIALPLLLRSLTALPWSAGSGLDGFDATSVYGYAGPIASASTVAADVAARFRRAMLDHFTKEGVISVFSRLHPLLDQTTLTDGLGRCVPLGRTVSLDLDQTDEELLAGMHRAHRQDISSLHRRGSTFAVDDSLEHLPRFVEIYQENMRRLNASEHYQFPLEYFQQMCDDHEHAKLLVIRSNGQIACGGIFLVRGDIVQYHLSGTAEEYLPASPVKMLVFEACRWARQRGAKVLHLGGGVGSKDDPLFQFKARFGGSTHQFHVWRWIVNYDRYRQWCDFRIEQLQAEGKRFSDAEFFPQYRGPAIALNAGAEIETKEGVAP